MYFRKVYKINPRNDNVESIEKVVLHETEC